MPKPDKHVFVCTQARPPGHPRGSCSAGGAGALMQEFLKQFEQRALFPRMALTATGCMGPCNAGANVLVYPDAVMYSAVTAADVSANIDEHLLSGAPVQRLLTPVELWG